MAEELKINVGVGGAKEAEAALKGVASAEVSVGAAAQTGAAGVQKTTAAKKSASEATQELRMRNNSLLRDLAMVSPECAVAANAFQTLMMKTTGAGLALGLLGAAVGLVMIAYNKYSEAQAKEKQRAAELIQGLQEQSAAYQKLADSAEKAARAKGGRGIGAGAALAERALAVAAPGVGPAAAGRAADLAAVAGREITNEELRNLGIAVAVGREPAKGKDKQKVARMLGLDPASLQADLAKMPPREARRETAEAELQREALSPEGEVAERLAIIDRWLKIHPEATPKRMTALEGLLTRVRARPGLGVRRFSIPRMAPGPSAPLATSYFADEQGEQAITIIERATMGGVHYHDRAADQAGSIPRNSMQ